MPNPCSSWEEKENRIQKDLGVTSWSGILGAANAFYHVHDVGAEAQVLDLVEPAEPRKSAYFRMPMPVLTSIQLVMLLGTFFTVGFDFNSPTVAFSGWKSTSITS